MILRKVSLVKYRYKNLTRHFLQINGRLVYEQFGVKSFFRDAQLKDVSEMRLLLVKCIFQLWFILGFLKRNPFFIYFQKRVNLKRIRVSFNEVAATVQCRLADFTTPLMQKSCSQGLDRTQRVLLTYFCISQRVAIIFFFIPLNFFFTRIWHLSTWGCYTQMWLPDFL